MDAVDRRETVKRHFDAYAANNRWGDLYNPQNLHCYSFLKRRLRTVELLGDLGGKRLLDVGCGTGALIEPLISSDVEYEGIDIAPNMIEIVQTHIRELGLSSRFKVRVGSVEALPYSDSHFDAVAGMGLLEYFDDPAPVIREAIRVVKPGGIMVFTIPQKFCVDDFIIRGTAPFRRFVRQIIGKSDDIEREKYSPKEFQELFLKRGCEVAGERFYNKLILPYPISRFWPRLAYAAAAMVEENLQLKAFATGYILACKKPVSPK